MHHQLAIIIVVKKNQEAGIWERVANYNLQLSAEEIGYMAGIIDGEGTISILKVTKRKTHHILTPKISLANTDVRLVEWLANRTGTKINSRKRGNEKHRDQYQVQVGGYRCYNLLKMVEPWLTIKRPQCRLVMTFIESRLGQSYNAPYTETEIKIWRKVRELNLKGWQKSQTLHEVHPLFMTSKHQQKTSMPTES